MITEVATAQFTSNIKWNYDKSQNRQTQKQWMFITQNYTLLHLCQLV